MTLSAADLEAIRSRHESTDYNFPEVRVLDYASPSALLQRTHADRAALLSHIAASQAPAPELTPQMVENMARALGNTLRWPNQSERAREVWRAAWDKNPQPVPTF